MAQIFAYIRLISICVLIFLNFYVWKQLQVLNLSCDRSARIKSPWEYSRIIRRPRLAVPRPTRQKFQPDLVTRTTVKNVVQRLGYESVALNFDWDVLWMHDNLFGRKYESMKTMILSNLLPGQMVNHIPGMAAVCDKMTLTTMNPSKYIPKTFSMPEQQPKFLQEVKNSDDEGRLWIQKNKRHRGNQVKQLKDLDVNATDTLIQEFVANQFLVHGHVIQFGVYVIVTSVEPLRSYIYVNEMSNRMADKEFHPFDSNDIQKYVTDGDHSKIGIQDLPEMIRYFKVHYSKTQALKDYINSIGKNASKVYDQIYDAVTDVLLNVRDYLIHIKHGSKLFNRPNFFDISRWDFIADEDLNVYLLEANFSPNIPSTPSRPRPKHESIVYSALSTINSERGYHFKDRHWVRNSDIHVVRDACFKTRCQLCKNKECQLCPHCLNQDQVAMLKASFTEHINRQGLRRTWPRPMTQEEDGLDETVDVNLPAFEQLNVAWFRAKCGQDFYWCT